MQGQFRADFMAIWGLSGGAAAWWTPFAGDHRSAGEWFAESYRLCALYGPQMPYQTSSTDWPTYGFPGDRDPIEQDAACRLILQVGATEGLPAPTTPTVYAPRVVVQANRKVAECHRKDLLLLGKQVLCETASGGSPTGPWIIMLQSRRMGKTRLRRAHLTAADGQPLFALARR